jgi:Fe-S cluster assembly protein SufD
MEVAETNIVEKFMETVQGSFSKGIFIEEQRETALQQIHANRFPTSRDEYWKYTRVNRISTQDFKIQKAAIANIDAFKIKDLDSTVLVFVNGFFAPEWSSQNLPSEITVFSCNDLLTNASKESEEVFDQINTAFATDGVQIHVAKNTTIEKPIEIIHIQVGEQIISNIFHHIELERHAQAKIVQSFHSVDANSCFTNVRSYVKVQEGAHLSITKLQTEENQNYHIATENVAQDGNSNFTINTITLGGALVRNNLNISVDGQNCDTNLNSAYILKENQHVDNHTIVDHRMPNCLSNELYKGVIDDKATAVFNGKVFVRPDAQKINAFQSNGNVLLSPNATINSKPELEIYADDVKCSHGSTTGQLDENAVFYLRSRGMSEKQARELLVQAFVADVLDKLDASIRAFVDQVLETKFGWEAMD